MTEIIRVFIGCAANHEDAESQAVLEYTLRKHASQPIAIDWMKQSHDQSSPWCGWDTSRWATPFSGFRWGIPLCTGRAIYMDSDVIVMGDVAELWNTQLQPGKAIVARGAGSWRFCVSLWDCDKLYELMPDYPRDMDLLRRDPAMHKTMSGIFRNSPLVQPFVLDHNWNCLDGEEYIYLRDPRIKAIHYTSMDAQPHLRYAIPRLEREGRRHWFDGAIKQHWRPDLIQLFDNMLAEAYAAGFGLDRYTQDPIFGDYRKASLKSYKGARSRVKK